MNRKSTLAAIGGYQPFIFCIGMYFVALFFSIFICSAIFYAVNPKQPPVAASKIPAKNSTALLTGSSQILITASK